MKHHYLLSIIDLSYINYYLYEDNLKEHVETFAKKQTSSLFSMFSIYIKTLAKKPPSSDYKITSHYIESSFIRSPIDLGKPELVSKIVTKSFRDTMYLDEKL